MKILKYEETMHLELRAKHRDPQFSKSLLPDNGKELKLSLAIF